MPCITMENNAIHNNEGFGVILVKPGNGDHLQVPADRTEGEHHFSCVHCQQRRYLTLLLLAEDATAETAADPHSATSSSSDTPTSSNSTPVQTESAESSSTDGDVASITGRKWQLSRQLSRNKEASCSRPVQDLMEHQIFVSVQENQFKRNGRGDFGTFFF